MSWQTRLQRMAISGTVVIAGCSVTAAVAHADGVERLGSSIAVSAAPSSGSTLQISVSGTNAPADGVIGGFDYDVDLFIMDPKIFSATCAAAESEEEDYAMSDPSAVALVTSGPLDVGASGPFSLTYPVDVSDYVPGPRLVCAYDMYDSFVDAAWASAATTVTGTRPAVDARPRVSRSGNRLRCRRGSWSHTPTSYRYAWTIVHARGTVGRRATLSITQRLHKRQVVCAVTASNTAGRATASSRPYRIN